MNCEQNNFTLYVVFSALNCKIIWGNIFSNPAFFFNLRGTSRLTGNSNANISSGGFQV